MLQIDTIISFRFHVDIVIFMSKSIINIIIIIIIMFGSDKCY